ncbi:MAG TPA: VWA domain-containing protein, partial [Vicinamibacteria bacterium]
MAEFRPHFRQGRRQAFCVPSPAGEDLTQEKRGLETVKTSRRMSSVRYRAAAVIAAVSWLGVAAAIRAQDGQEGFRFTSGVDLVNVTATVTDSRGRFVDELEQDDFVVFENGKRQEVSHFSAGKVPVSLGIVLDSSGSMTPEKMAAARAAINRLVFELLDAEDELFFMRFSSEPRLMQDWTSDRHAIARAVERVVPSGGTAIYDAIARALPLAAEGQHRKKAVLVISDGNDTSSDASVGQLRNLIRDSEVLVYALGVDGTERQRFDNRPAP